MEKTLKILLIMPFFYPHRGGSQKYAEELYSEMMKKHENVTVDVLTYNTDHVEKYEEYRGFRIHRIPCFNVIPARFALPNIVELQKILNKLSKNKYDIVNTHIRFFDPTWWVWKYAKGINAKSFFTGHVATHPEHQNPIVRWVSKTVDLTIAKWSLKKYDIHTYVSKTTQKFFETTLGIKNPSTIIYGSIDTDFFSPKEKKSRVIPKTNQKIPDDTVLITYVGRMIWTKGVTYLYEAIKNLDKMDKLKNIIFVLAGPGELEETLKNNIIKDALKDKVFMTGNLNYEQVRDLLAISDIYINPSHHSEGFPLTILEAGASGCYVIATDNAGTWEAVENDVTGKLIEQKDVEQIVNSILWAMDNPKETKENIRNFMKKIKENYDYKVTSEQLYTLLIESIK